MLEVLADARPTLLVGAMSMFDASEGHRVNLYRQAYGEASRLVEIARFDHCWGRDFAAGIGNHAEAILAEVRRRLGADHDSETVLIAVEDAMTGRQPRW